MLKIISLNRADIGLRESALLEGLKTLQDLGAVTSFKVTKKLVTIALDAVRAEMVLEHLTGIEPHNPQNMPKSKKGSYYEDA